VEIRPARVNGKKTDPQSQKVKTRKRREKDDAKEIFTREKKALKEGKVSREGVENNRQVIRGTPRVEDT